MTTTTSTSSSSGLDLSALGLTAASTGSSTAKSADNLSQSDFLKLLTTQLKSQDPLNPMDNTAFVSQMAQFSSLSGITEMNTKLGSILSAMNQGQISSATGLVGKYVLTEGSTAVQDSNGYVFGSVDVPSGATNVTVAIKDSAGKTLRTLSMTPSADGATEFGWDGTDGAGNALTPGTVTVSATASVGGTTQALNTSVYGLVSSVTLPSSTSSAMTLDVLGVGPIDISKVQKVGS